MSIDVQSLPLEGRAYRLGVNPITTTLVLLGPVVIGCLAIAGRNSVTVGIAFVYVFMLPASVLLFWMRGMAAGDNESDGSNENGDD